MFLVLVHVAFCLFSLCSISITIESKWNASRRRFFALLLCLPPRLLPFSMPFSLVHLPVLCPLCILLKDLRYDSMKVAALMHQVVGNK